MKRVMIIALTGLLIIPSIIGTLRGDCDITCVGYTCLQHLNGATPPGVTLNYSVLNSEDCKRDYLHDVDYGMVRDGSQTRSVQRMHTADPFCDEWESFQNKYRTADNCLYDVEGVDPVDLTCGTACVIDE